MNALLVHDGYFPFGTAFAARLYYLALILKESGYNVHVITAYTKEKKEINETYCINDITYDISDFRNRGSLDTFIGPKRFMKTISNYIKLHDVDVVITSRGVSYYNKLVRLCHKYKIKCIVEQCEWLDVSSFKFKNADIRYIRMLQLFCKGYKSADGIIAISRLLEKHFNKIGVRTVRIPTILDVDSIQFSETANEKTIIVFTGSLGARKELLYPLYKVLSDNQDLQNQIEFHIYGPSKEAVINNVGDKTLVNGLKNVFYHGFVSKTEVQRAISEADFQFFIRPNRRSSNAGCPTKMGESMAAGTPLITNNTGDISLYVDSGINGYLVDDGDMIESLTGILKRIVNQTYSERLCVRKSARSTAEQSFNYKNYKTVLCGLINGND